MLNKLNFTKNHPLQSDDIRMPTIKRPSTTICFRAFILFFLVTICSSFFLPKLTTRFCYISQDPARVNSQCVYCNYYLFDSVLLGCTGSSALTVNITATQAFCVISQCLNQIKQAPVFIGRRRKRDSDDEFSEMKSEAKEENNALVNKKSETTDQSTLNDSSKEQVQKPEKSSRATTSMYENSRYEEEVKRRDALIQQEALDSLSSAAYTANSEREDEVLETTTEVIEFNLNGEQHKYIVKKEVQAMIVDLPDSVDATYPIAG